MSAPKQLPQGYGAQVEWQKALWYCMQMPGPDASIGIPDSLLRMLHGNLKPLTIAGIPKGGLGWEKSLPDANDMRHNWLMIESVLIDSVIRHQRGRGDAPSLKAVRMALVRPSGIYLETIDLTPAPKREEPVFLWLTDDRHQMPRAQVRFWVDHSDEVYEQLGELGEHVAEWRQGLCRTSH